jgi:hypothetical protein
MQRNIERPAKKCQRKSVSSAANFQIMKTDKPLPAVRKPRPPFSAAILLDNNCYNQAAAAVAFSYWLMKCPSLLIRL